MSRLFLLRSREGKNLARSLADPDDCQMALAPGELSEAEGDGIRAVEVAGEASRELVHLIFESDVVIVC